MCRTPKTTLLFLAVLISICPRAWSQSSTSTISLQGKLSGVADGNHAITVRFYDAATGGAIVQSVPVGGVNVSGGVFSAGVPVSAASFNGASRWWTVSVDGGVETQRTLVTSVPYALQASGGGTANSPFSVAGDLTVGSTLYFYNPMRFSPEPGLNLVGVNDGAMELTGFHVRLRAGGEAGEEVLLADDHGVLTLKSGSGFTLKQELPNGSVTTHLTLGDNAHFHVLTAADFDDNVSARTLTIRGGADVAEPFQIAKNTAETATTPLPGMVMVIDPANPGKLKLATTTYDTKVAGVISGANSLAPGLVLKSVGQPLADGEQPIAMTGRVWVWCDAGEAAITPGDRLTTSTTPGHAMKATDRERADGAVIGKAMTELKDGKGLVLVLVNLQ